MSSLLKTISSGIQDKRLYYEKTIFPFLKKWSRAGRFATRWERLDFTSIPKFGTSSNVFVKNKGELVSRICIVATLPDIYTPQKNAIDIAGTNFAGPRFGWTNSVGHALLRNITLSIGGSIVENLDHRLLEMLDEYNTPLEKLPAVNRAIKRKDNGFGETSFGNETIPTTVIIPIPFWFSRGDFTTPLPIDAMRNDDVVINVKFNTMNAVYYSDSRNMTTNIFQEDGSRLWDINGSKFYKSDASGTDISGLYLGNIPQTQKVSPIPNVSMPTTFTLGETYLLAEYIYLDSPEANRFRNTELQVPIIQHYILPPFPNLDRSLVSMPITVKNPVKELYWFAQRIESTPYNAHFLATHDINKYGHKIPWWPDATGLDSRQPGFMRGAFVLSNSEPIEGIALVYEGKYVRFRTEMPALFRAILPSLEQKKTPWVNRYYYNLSFGINNTETPLSVPRGEANFGKIKHIRLDLHLKHMRGKFETYAERVPDMVIYAFAETYNILKIYDGRAVLMFNY